MRLQFWKRFWQVLGGVYVVDDTMKEFLDSLSIFGRSLAKAQRLVSSPSDAFLPCDCPVLLEIRLVTDQDADSFDLTVFPKQLKPNLNSLESLSSSHIVDEYCAVSIFDIVWHQALEFLLAGSIPELQSVDRTFIVNILHQKVYAYSLLK